MFEIDIPTNVEIILDTLHANGYEAYIVGGCVRDSILGLHPKDWDICTSALPSQTLEVFKDKRIIETGLKHGTVTVILDSVQYEVTTFRTDGEYSDNRHPDSVQFVSNLNEDLARRDFTINALAYCKESGLIDIYNGYNDLRENIVSCVRNPDERFNEDALRIMRALRFASVYGFRISDSTKESIHKNKDLLKNIAFERINVELCKLLNGKGVLNILLNYNDVIATIIPELKPCIGFNQNNKYHMYNVYDHIAYAVWNYKGNDTVIKMALLLHDIGKPHCYSEDYNGGHFYNHGTFSHDIAEEVLTKLKFDNKTKHDVLELVLYHDATIEPTKKVVRRWLSKIGEKQFRRLLEIRIADILAHFNLTQEYRIDKVVIIGSILDEVIESENCFTIKDLKINGNDIIEMGLPEGKEVGEILKVLLENIINGEIPNEREYLYQCASNMVYHYLNKENE